MNKITLLMLLTAGASLQPTAAQLVNNGTKIGISSGGLFFVDGSLNNQSGTFLNNGRLVIKGDWQNNDADFTVFNKLSTGIVELSGADQNISGAYPTEFPSLTLSGSGTKTLGINTDVTGILNLNDRELKTDAFILSILNAQPAAVIRSTGFVSTDNKGQLVRILNSTNPYLFPLGTSADGSAVYRPVEVEQLDNVQNYFAAAFIKKDPSSAGYNRQSKRQGIETVFEKYYHILDQNGSSGLNIRFFQNTAEDGELKQLVNWSSSGIWEKAAPSSVTSGSFGDGLNQNLLYSSREVITTMPFTLASANNEGPFTFFNAFSPDGDGKNDTWEIKNLDLYPDNDLSVFNRWGDEVFKTKGYSSAKAWDGGNLNPGTYYYILSVDVDGERKSYKGFITMVKKD